MSAMDAKLSLITERRMEDDSLCPRRVSHGFPLLLNTCHVFLSLWMANARFRTFCCCVCGLKRQFNALEETLALSGTQRFLEGLLRANKAQEIAL